METEGDRQRDKEVWKVAGWRLTKQLALFTEASSRTNANHTQCRDTRVNVCV